MAAELRELGLTEEELENIAYYRDKSVSNTSSKTRMKSNNEVRHKKEKKELSEKKRHKKKGAMVGYFKSPGSDSDSSSESNDNVYSSPRGLQYEQSSQDIEGGRGKPFYPNAINPCTLYSQGAADTYNRANRMARDLNPLIQMTGSAMFRNNTIEDLWARNKSPNTISNSSLSKNKYSMIECKTTALTLDPKTVTNPVNIGKPINSVTNTHTPEQPYKNALINMHNNETNSSSDESNLHGKIDRLSIKISSNNCDKKDVKNVDMSILKKTEDRVKTQLYIPPHMRKRNVETKAGDSTSDCSVATQPVKQESHPVPVPPKKSMAELTRKNVLISGLLRKKQNQQQSSQSAQCPNQPSPAIGSLSASSSDVSLGYSQPSPGSVILSSISTHSDFCDTDVCSTPGQSEPSPPPLHLPPDLVEFYDIGEDRDREDLPLRPPPEFGGNDSDSYFYYDEDTKEFIHYRIPESPSESSNGASSQMSYTAVHGSSSSRSSFNGSVGHGAYRNSVRSKNKTPGSVNERSSTGDPSIVNGRGMSLSPSNPTRSPHSSSDTGAPGTGFWPLFGSDSEYFDKEYPSLS